MLSNPAKLMLGMPTYRESWTGNTAQEQVDWVVKDKTVGVAIWDATLTNNGTPSAQWRSANMWNMLKQVRGGVATPSSTAPSSSLAPSSSRPASSSLAPSSSRAASSSAALSSQGGVDGCAGIPAWQAGVSQPKNGNLFTHCPTRRKFEARNNPGTWETPLNCNGGDSWFWLDRGTCGTVAPSSTAASSSRPASSSVAPSSSLPASSTAASSSRPASSSAALSSSAATGCTAPAWKSGTAYAAGAQVQSVGKLYQCRAWPYNGWCGAGSAYEPGVGFAWADAWTQVGDCAAPAPQAWEEVAHVANHATSGLVKVQVRLEGRTLLVESRNAGVLELLDLSGRAARRFSFGPGGGAVELDGLHSGRYLARWASGETRGMEPLSLR